MPSPDSHRLPDPVVDLPAEDLWMAGVESIDLDELAGNPNYADLLALLARHKSVLQRRRVTSICEGDRSHFNGEGVLRIAREDFTREGLCALLGVTDDGSIVESAPNDPSAAPAVNPTVAPPRRPAAAPTAARQTQQFYRSGLLGVLRSVLPPHTANTLAASISETAAHQLEQEVQHAESQRDRIAAWFAQKRLGAGAMAKPTDELHARFNFLRPDGTYSGYSLRISSLPPFLMTYIKATQVGGRWETTMMFEDQPYEKVRASLGA